jgi:hypothetical protein
MMKSLFIRCSQETYDLAHALAKKESRSLNKQIIHMIHSMADEKNVAVEKLLQESKEAVEVTKNVPEGTTVEINVPDPKWGLTGLAETKKQDFPD